MSSAQSRDRDWQILGIFNIVSQHSLLNKCLSTERENEKCREEGGRREKEREGERDRERRMTHED